MAKDAKRTKPLNMNELGKRLSVLYEQILYEYGNTPVVRLAIAQYTMGYMGASYGIHIPQ